MNMVEINKDWYCQLNAYTNTVLRKTCGHGTRTRNCEEIELCRARHRKWPTPEQFLEEYGFKYPDDGAVWERFKKPLTEGVPEKWLLVYHSHRYGNEAATDCVCACTPWGKPPDDWSPQ